MRMLAGVLAVLALAPSASGATVSGRVLGSAGRPLGGATVSAFAPEGSRAQAERWMAGRPRPVLASAATAADGSFRLTVDRPVFWLQAAAEGHRPAADGPAGESPVTLTLARAALRRGVITARGRPVPGAVVVWTSSDGAELLVRSAADGSYEVPDPARWVRVAVLHPDFAPESLSVWKDHGPEWELEPGIALAGSVVDEASGKGVAGAAVWIDGSWPLGRTDERGAFRIRNAPREWTTAVAWSDRGVGVARPRVGPLVIALKPARSLSGTVREEKGGAPVAGVRVALSATTEPRHRAEAYTDERGQYTLDGLPANAYRLEAGRFGFLPTGIGARGEGSIDLRASRSARRDLALARLPRLGGRVEDEQGRPIEGALVAVGRHDVPNFYARDPALEGMAFVWGPHESARSAADGTFALLTAMEEAPENEKPLIVLKAGFAAGRVDVREMTAHARSSLVVRLVRGVEIRGSIRTPEGAAVPGVAVTLVEAGGSGRNALPIYRELTAALDEGWTTSDADGTFSVRVHPTVHHLAFRKAGHARQSVPAHDPRQGTALEVVLEPAAAVRGRVSRPDGRGVPGVTVMVVGDLERAVDQAMTEADGGFEIGDLAPGAYQLMAGSEALGLVETRVVQAPALDVQIVMARGTLRGRVLDAATRKPVPRFQVALGTEGPSEEGGGLDVADPGGAFTLEDVPLGDVGLTVSAEGYATKHAADVPVSAEGEGPELEIALEADAPLRGRVTTADHAPIPDAGVTVGFDEAEPTPSASATSDENGEYELRGLAPAPLTVHFAAEGFLPEKRSVDTRQAGRLDVSLRPGLSLRGQVVMDGAGVHDAFVLASSSALDAPPASARTDAQGHFVMQGLAAARYTVTARLRSGGTAKAVDVEPARSGPLRLVLEKGLTAVVTGKVVGLPAGELGSVLVSVRGEDRRSAQSTADDTRSFRVEDAPAGPVTVGASFYSTSGTSRASRTVALTLAAGSQAETVVEFSSDVVVHGLVLRDGAPVPGARVAFTSGSAGWTARTDTRGAYEVVGLEPGPYEVSAGDRGDEVLTFTHTVSGSGQLDIDITGAAISGYVVRAEGGVPLPGVAISFYEAGGDGHTSVATVLTDSRGSFRQRLREGRYRLVTAKPGFGQQVRELEAAAPGATAEVTVELSPAEGIDVAVVDARDGRPLAATVIVRDAARRVVADRSEADDKGRLNIPLTPGSYLLSASAQGYGTVTRPVTSPGPGVRVELTPGGTLVIESPRVLRGRVRLVLPDGEEYVRCECNGIAEIQLDGRRTTIEHITPGSYTVELLGEGETRGQPVVIREGRTSTVTVE